MTNIEKLAKQIKNSKRIVFFTGAGVSTESGIADFRSTKGMYSSKYGGYEGETILSRDFFFNNTELFYKFYFDNIVITDALPNDFHNGITKLSEAGYEVSVVTQNIDDLHGIAGNTNIYELHGTIAKNYCIQCNEFHNLAYMLENKGDYVKCRQCGGLVKPDVVLYGEQLDYSVISQAVQAITDADVLIIAGTSLMVYPASSFVDYYNNNCFVIMNLSKTPQDHKADYVFYDSCSKTLNSVLDKLDEM